ncbi:uncharacterized protein LOC112595429 isoform X2 [Melanaphis sacchari]|uniref:uncharacterized protein LOC112595429 isoform X2 n=1 Tax=Melanaphis sacchari TaxID=742174 RepID=UPI000DC134AF|nr:uncharacterized protein LOC112595429 isoform X2 [Melanaphis sacchari]
MILKSFGCQPMCMIRCFSEAIEVSKIKRKHIRNVNYYMPLLSEARRESIKKIVSIQMSGHYLSCTTILRDGNILKDWKVLNMPEEMNKFNLDDVYNSVAALMKDIPESDIYLIENHVKMPNNVNVAGANLFYVKLQTLAMLIALINNSQAMNTSSDNTQSMNKVVLMKARLHARLFRIIIGTEIISSQDITEMMLKGIFPEYITPVVPAIDAILTYRSMKEPIIKELMSNGLMLAMTFVDLVLNSNPKSIQALNESSKRKLKTTKKL